MRKILIKMIKLYQVMPLHTHSMCRFVPSCSEYTKDAIEQYGSIKGCFLGMKRILRCIPFGSSGYDPVPEALQNKKTDV